MVDLDFVLRTSVYPAFDVLPPRMESTAATLLMLAIGLQESRFTHRRQVRGPARGYWQFEAGGGVAGVMNHGATSGIAQRLVADMRYPFQVDALHAAIEHNDVLAACFARLLLWTDPRPLPAVESGPDAGWHYYVSIWRPGKPHRDTFDDLWRRAYAEVVA